MSTQKKYKLAFVIGRFQPFHNGHLDLIKTADSLAKNVMVFVGSAFTPRTAKNPLDRHEVIDLIQKTAIKEGICDQLAFSALYDYFYDDAKWAKQVTDMVAQYGYEDSDVVMVGHKKYDTEFYINMFPQFDYVDVPTNWFIPGTQSPINASWVRELCYKGMFENSEILYNKFTDKDREGLKNSVPEATYNYLKNYCNLRNRDFCNIIDEIRFVREYKRMWERVPYPVTFSTVDAIVARSNHVLLVKRKHAPGKGLWALPGGFINQKETLKDAAIRELFEETKLNVPRTLLERSLKDYHIFDYPGRSTRGRTITTGFYFELPPGKLDKVRGSDDAEEAKWINISELDPTEMYEDHWSIINYFLKV